MNRRWGGVWQWVCPRSCWGCGCERPEAFRFLCRACWSSLTLVEPPFCSRCGDPVAGVVEFDFVCYFCGGREGGFDGARSVARYEGVMSEMIQTLKYRRGFWLVPDLVEMLTGLVRAEFAGVEWDAVVPVPLHRLRRRERGFNQSALLAGGLSKRLGVAYLPRAVRRVVPTLTQTHLTAEERMSNVSGAFEVCEVDRVRDRSLLLVDDVMTTGATMYACAQALRRAGAKVVCAVSVARG